LYQQIGQLKVERHFLAKVNIEMKFEVLHMTDYLGRLIKEGRIKLTKDV